MNNLSKNSIKLLRQVKRAILAEPEFYDQSRIPADSCDSPCCLLGWAVWINKPELFKSMLTQEAAEFEWDGVATKILGLDRVLPDIEDKWRLFGSGATWPREFRAALREAGTPKERAMVAAARIEHFIATGGAE